MYRLYSIPGSCSMGIHALLNRLGQDVELIYRDDVADYAALVPTNQVPALVDGDDLLAEGAAIVLHLLEKHGGGPVSPVDAREFHRWLMFNYATLHPTYSKLFMAGVMNVIPKGESQDLLIAHISNRLNVLWRIVEARLDGREFMLGREPTVIDYLLAVYANWDRAVPAATISRGPNTQDLIRRVIALPEFSLALEREGVDYPLAA